MDLWQPREEILNFYYKKKAIFVIAIIMYILCIYLSIHCIIMAAKASMQKLDLWLPVQPNSDSLCICILMQSLIICSHPIFFHRALELFHVQNEHCPSDEKLFNILFYPHWLMCDPIPLLLHTIQTPIWRQIYFLHEIFLWLVSL